MPIKRIFHFGSRKPLSFGFDVGESSFAAYELFSGSVIVSSKAALSYKNPSKI